MIVLSAVGDEHEKIAALDAGADDYVTKPVGIDELLARLRASLRRAAPSLEPVITIGGLVVDLEKRLVTVDGKEVNLTPHQFDILRVLARNPGKLVTHRSLLREVWGPGYGSESNLLHVHVSQLRRRIEPDPARPRYLITAPGAGYRLVNPTDAPRARRSLQTPIQRSRSRWVGARRREPRWRRARCGTARRPPTPSARERPSASGPPVADG